MSSRTVYQECYPLARKDTTAISGSGIGVHCYSYTFSSGRAAPHAATVASAGGVSPFEPSGPVFRPSMSPAVQLLAYLDEIPFRFSNRDNPYLLRDTLRKLIGSENLPYSELVS